MASILLRRHEAETLGKTQKGSIVNGKIGLPSGRDYPWRHHKPTLVPVGNKGGAFGGDHESARKFIKEYARLKMRDQGLTDIEKHGYAKMSAELDVKEKLQQLNKDYEHHFTRWLNGDSTANNINVTPWGKKKLNLKGINQFVQDNIQKSLVYKKFVYRLYFDGPPKNKQTSEWYFRYLVYPYLESRRLVQETYENTEYIFDASDADDDLAEFFWRHMYDGYFVSIWPAEVRYAGFYPGGLRPKNQETVELIGQDPNQFTMISKRPILLDPAVNPYLRDVGTEIPWDLFFKDDKGPTVAEWEKILQYTGARNIRNVDPNTWNEPFDKNLPLKHPQEAATVEFGEKGSRMIHGPRKNRVLRTIEIKPEDMDDDSFSSGGEEPPKQNVTVPSNVPLPPPIAPGAPMPLNVDLPPPPPANLPDTSQDPQQPDANDDFSDDEAPVPVPSNAPIPPPIAPGQPMPTNAQLPPAPPADIPAPAANPPPVSYASLPENHKNPSAQQAPEPIHNELMRVDPKSNGTLPSRGGSAMSIPAEPDELQQRLEALKKDEPKAIEPAPSKKEKSVPQRKGNKLIEGGKHRKLALEAAKKDRQKTRADHREMRRLNPPYPSEEPAVLMDVEKKAEKRILELEDEMGKAKRGKKNDTQQYMSRALAIIRQEFEPHHATAMELVNEHSNPQQEHISSQYSKVKTEENLSRAVVLWEDIGERLAKENQVSGYHEPASFSSAANIGKIALGKAKEKGANTTPPKQPETHPTSAETKKDNYEQSASEVSKYTDLIKKLETKLQDNKGATRKIVETKIALVKGKLKEAKNRFDKLRAEKMEAEKKGKRKEGFDVRRKDPTEKEERKTKRKAKE